MKLMLYIAIALMATACSKSTTRVQEPTDTVTIRVPEPPITPEPGEDGKDGLSCTVIELDAGAQILCEDGTTATISNGTDGSDAPPTNFTIIDTIDPCGPEAVFDEVLLRLADDSLLAFFAGSGGFLTLIGPGNYITTDGTNCQFAVDSNMNVLFDSLVLLSPARDYDPSEFFPSEVVLSPGTYQLPGSLPLEEGTAGTGWATISIGDTSYCYQGDGVNNSDPGTEFVYEGSFTGAGDCFSASLTAEPLEVILESDTTVVAEVNGGGVSAAIRDYTEVEVEIISNEVH